MKENKISDNPRVYTIIAAILGYALIGNYSANEQNAIGNFLILIGQVIETNSAIQQSLHPNNNNSNKDVNISDFINKDSNELKKIQDMLDFLSKQIKK